VNRRQCLRFFEFWRGAFSRNRKKTLRGFQPDQSMVIATGGGVPCFNDNMDFIKQNGVSIFLNVDVNDLATRLYKAQGNNRPLLDKTQSEEVVIASIKKPLKNVFLFISKLIFK